MIGLLEEEVKMASAAANDSPLALPMPTDERALALAQRVLTQPLNGESVDELAPRHVVSRLTLERATATKPA